MDGDYYKIRLANVTWAADILRLTGNKERADVFLDMISYNEKNDTHYRIVSTLKEYFDFIAELRKLLDKDFTVHVSHDGQFINFS